MHRSPLPALPSVQHEYSISKAKPKTVSTTQSALVISFINVSLKTHWNAIQLFGYISKQYISVCIDREREWASV